MLNLPTGLGQDAERVVQDPMAVEAGSGTGPAGLTAQKLCIKKPPRDPEKPGHQILEPGRVSRTEPGSELQIGVAPPPVPSRQLGARGPAPREPQPFPGGGPGAAATPQLLPRQVRAGRRNAARLTHQRLLPTCAARP